MSESKRPSIQSVQRSLLVGALVGVILGCLVGVVLSTFYIRQNPPVYAGGAYPDELTGNYQDHYIAMVIDSYVVNGRTDVATERLKSFDTQAKIRALARWSANYVAAQRTAEAQAVNDLAQQLKQQEGWPPEAISSVVTELRNQYEANNEVAKVQGINTFASALNLVPVEGGGEAAAPQQPPAQEGPPPAQAAPSEGGGGFPLGRLLIGCLLVLVVLLGGFLLFRRIQAMRGPAGPPSIEETWEGEGPAPIKQWESTYTLGQDIYDEFFTIETNDGLFLGESGVGILDAVPDTSPKQVLTFDVGLFDKTDITTLSRVVMSEHAYNDEALRAKVEANPQAEAVLAEPGKAFTLETTAMRIDAEIKDMAYGEEDNVYFEKLTIALDVFVKEGADLREGEMDIPEEYQEYQ